MHGSITSRAQSGRTVRTQAGRLRGAARDESGVLAFKGIPYAAPPLGPLRWRAPQAPVPWTGARDALAFGPASLSSLENDQRPGPRSEDCLTLNVWSPSGAQRLPVIVWFHGGGFRTGATGMPLMNGKLLAQRGVVVVTANYRSVSYTHLTLPTNREV